MFDNYISRWETNSAKWDEAKGATNSNDVISLSVADMDFRSSPEIIQGMVAFANHGIYGYSNISEDYLSITKEWIRDQYEWDINKNWIIFSPRVIQTVSLLIQRYSEVGDGVVVQSPAYGPLKKAIEVNNRKVLTNSLVYKNGKYEINFDDLENKLKEKAKIMILISPQNPVGRIWNKEELTKIVKLCKKYNVLLISDEVHADFTWGKEFITSGRLIDEVEYNKIVICMSPGKTFNIPGLEVTNVIIKDKEIREEFEILLKQAGIHNPQFFAVPALEKAYGESKEWLSLVKDRISDNINFVEKFFQENLFEFKVSKPEATFLLWINYQDTGLCEEDISKIFFDHAKVAVSLGSSFGIEGKGFFRINVALPKKRLKEAMNRILHAYNDWREHDE